jgi:predicted component of type VI protein secretion system
LKRHTTAAIAVCALVLFCAGCSSVDSMMGGNDRQQALAEADWNFAEDAVTIEIEADPRMNQYGGQSHTLLLGIYQMAEADPFYKSIADPAILGRQLGGIDGADGAQGFVQFVRYVVKPGGHSILLLDRAQKARFVGIVAGYYKLSAKNAARLFEIPLQVRSKGLIGTTYSAAPAALALRLVLGADGIVNAQVSRCSPADAKKRSAVPLEEGGKEIKLDAERQRNDPLQKPES